jgi:hypothetical protein
MEAKSLQPSDMAIIMPVYSPIAHPVRQWLVALIARRLRSTS